MKKPNFFIIGAPKCGTTSMATWLSEHPNIYMSPVKEPYYFSDDIGSPNKLSFNQYQSLFKGADEQHIAIGEASTDYLYSKVAVANILHYASNAKFIVMLRNPVEMAPSLHGQALYSGNEYVKDFQKAWQLQNERASGRYVMLCRDPKVLLYGPRCKLGEQLERVYNSVPKERVLTILMDDMKLNPRKEYVRVLKFLGIDDDGRNEFPVFNTAKKRKSYLLTKAIGTTHLVRQKLKIPALHSGILKKVNTYNTEQRERKELSQEMREQLIYFFKEDIEKLSYLLERDLSHWVKC